MKGVGKGLDCVRVWKVTDATLQVADAADTKTSARGQRLLGIPGGEAIPTQ
jgi:hypothetical protein